MKSVRPISRKRVLAAHVRQGPFLDVLEKALGLLLQRVQTKAGEKKEDEGA